eukprot:8766178-Pyramimonas_sp.AAC.1
MSRVGRSTTFLLLFIPHDPPLESPVYTVTSHSVQHDTTHNTLAAVQYGQYAPDTPVGVVVRRLANGYTAVWATPLAEG